MLAQRIVTAIVLVALLAVVLLVLPHKVAVPVLAAMILAGAWEWATLAGLRGPAAHLAYVGGCALVMAGLWFGTTDTARLHGVLIVSLLGWVPLFGWIVFAPKRVNRVLAVVAGLWVLAPMWLALARLYLQDDQGPELVIFALLLIAAADIGAYLAGRRFGRIHLAAIVSPNKTWEGVLGGLVGGALVSLAGAAWFGLPRSAFLGLCIAAVLLSVVGDLLESMFKRQNGVKDSGSVLPGHGGVLDRIDSLTAALPLLALGFSWLGLVK